MYTKAFLGAMCSNKLLFMYFQVIGLLNFQTSVRGSFRVFPNLFALFSKLLEQKYWFGAFFLCLRGNIYWDTLCTHLYISLDHLSLSTGRWYQMQIYFIPSGHMLMFSS